MESPANNQPSISALLNRQLSDWQTLLTQLREQQASSAELDYCQAQIDRFQNELHSLN